MIVRHGQTYFNVKKRVQGWCDSPLTLVGIKQAQSLKHIGIQVDRAYSSTSERCQDTMFEIIGQRDIPYQSLKAFKEIHFGSAEGEYIQDVFPKGTAHLDGYTELGGETKAQAKDRFLSELERIAIQYPDETILIVSHGSVLKEVFASIDLSFYDDLIKANGSVNKLLPNCSLSILNYDGKFKLLSYGKTYYVQEDLC